MNNFNLPKTHSRDFDYFLGFFAADGNVSTNMLRIKIHSKDRQVLIYMSNTLESLGWKPKLKLNCQSAKLKNGTISTYDSLTVCSKQLCAQFSKQLGFGPRKSRTIRIPKLISHPADFIRGYFDGDGNISTRRNNKYIHIQFNSLSKEFLEDLDILINRYLKIGKKSIRVLGKYKCARLEYSCSDAIKLAEWMYDNTNLCIDRKKSLWLFLEPLKDKRKTWSKQDIKLLIKANPHSKDEYNQIAIELGKTYHSVQCKTVRLRA